MKRLSQPQVRQSLLTETILYPSAKSNTIISVKSEQEFEGYKGLTTFIIGDRVSDG